MPASTPLVDVDARALIEASRARVAPMLAHTAQALWRSPSTAARDLARIAMHDDAIARRIRALALGAALDDGTADGVVTLEIGADAHPMDADVDAHELERAIVRVGVAGVRLAALDTALARKSARRDRYRYLVTAAIALGRSLSTRARVLASKHGESEADAALCGLCHALGAVAIVDAVRALSLRAPLASEEVSAFIDREHAIAAAVVARSFSVDAAIVDALARHHQGDVTGLARVVVDAERTATAHVRSAGALTFTT
ncbi:MAG TPA: HDOD domain-containing protein [Myxococcota bacterium]|jgi:hypothetical protein